MARGVKEWYDFLITEKNTMSTLNNLQPNVDTAQDLLSEVNSPSKVADWRLYLWLVAVAAAAVDLIFGLENNYERDLQSNETRYLR